MNSINCRARESSSEIKLMSNTVSDLKSDCLINKINEQSIENNVEKAENIVKPKLNVTGFFLLLLLFFCVTLCSFSLLFYQQQKQVNFVEQQHSFDKVQLQQTVYLLKANNLIELLSTPQKTPNYIPFQQELSAITKKLVQMNSTHQSIFLKWQAKDSSQQNILARIDLHQARNERIQTAFVNQLSIIVAELKNQQKKNAESTDSRQLYSELSQVLTLTKSIDLHMPLTTFGRLREGIEHIFTYELFEEIHKKQINNESLSEFELQLVTLETIVFADGLLAKWQGHLRLAGEYLQQLSIMQTQVIELLNTLSDENISRIPPAKLPSFVVLDSSNSLGSSSLQVILVFVVLFSFASLLWFIRQRIQEYNAKYDVLYSSIKKAKASDKKIRQLESNHQQLKEKLNSADINVKEQASAFELFKSKSHSMSLVQLSQQQRWDDKVSDINIAQLTALTLLAVDKGLVTTEIDELYKQSSQLALAIKQRKLHHYLQLDTATLSLDDVNLIAEIQAVLFNQSADLDCHENQINLKVDDNVQINVKLDITIFSELVRSFIQLMLTGQSKVNLVIHLSLKDKNDGQQRLSFSGVVKSVDKLSLTKVALPTELECINKGKHEYSDSELLSYFYTLLAYQHGEQATVILTDQGYQFNFIVPLAVMNKSEKTVHSTLSVEANKRKGNSTLVNIMTNYQPQPVEVLLAVKMPKEQEPLLQLLTALGLQVTVVTHSTSQQKYWQSGRYALLVTEFSCSPFINFTNSCPENTFIQRAIVSLKHAFSAPENSQFSQWKIAKLASKLSLKGQYDVLSVLLSPWLKHKALDNVVSQVEISDVKSVDTVLDIRNTITNQLHSEGKKQLLHCHKQVALDWELYFLHQGSAELALYMLDDYLAENMTLVANLTQALAIDDFEVASQAIASLSLNAKILAAPHLIEYCQHWQALLAASASEVNSTLCVKLLSKTKQAVLAIDNFAQAI